MYGDDEDEIVKCAQSFYMFGIDLAQPYFFISGDGYIGLGLGNGGGNDTVSYSTLDQMVEHKIISKKMFGLYTRNSNENTPSQIRFGDYNPDLVKDGQSFEWVHTHSDDSWVVTL